MRNCDLELYLTSKAENSLTCNAKLASHRRYALCIHQSSRDYYMVQREDGMLLNTAVMGACSGRTFHIVSGQRAEYGRDLNWK